MIEALGIPMSNWCSKMVSRWASSGWSSTVTGWPCIPSSKRWTSARC